MTEPNELTQKMMRIILRGQVDDYLDSIVDALQRRKKYLRDRLALSMVATLEPGDRIIISKGIKPRYLENKRGTVIELPLGQAVAKRFYVWIQLDFGVGKFISGKIQMPASTLRLISKAKQPIQETQDNGAEVPGGFVLNSSDVMDYGEVLGK
jgi:hypothetical protein